VGRVIPERPVTLSLPSVSTNLLLITMLGTLKSRWRKPIIPLKLAQGFLEDITDTTINQTKQLNISF